MNALPSNLALVADDLARATAIDARRSLRRRRLATLVVACALLALVGTAAVAGGWPFSGETPVVRVIPSLQGSSSPDPAIPWSGSAAVGDVTESQSLHRAAQLRADSSAPLGQTDGTAPQTLLSGLGTADRMLRAVSTTSGGVCLTLTGFDPQCVPTFKASVQVDWFVQTTRSGAAIVWGLARDDVTGIDAVSAGLPDVAAQMGGGGFYVELPSGPPEQLVIHLGDGTSTVVTPLPCPLTTPDCAT